MQFSGKSQFSQKTQRARNGSHHATVPAVERKLQEKNAISNENFLKANLLSKIVLKLFLYSNVYLAFIDTSLQCCLYLADVWKISGKEYWRLQSKMKNVMENTFRKLCQWKTFDIVVVAIIVFVVLVVVLVVVLGVTNEKFDNQLIWKKFGKVSVEFVSHSVDFVLGELDKQQAALLGTENNINKQG